MSDYKLFMILMGCKPKGRNTEQHDIFFGIAKELRDLIPELQAFWPDAGSIHLDGFKIVTNVDGHQISISDKNDTQRNDNNLFFINLGGYKENEFEEFHYKMLSVASDRSVAIMASKKTAFFKHTSFGKIATSHIDDKYGVDVDDIYNIEEILSPATKEKFSINISENAVDGLKEDVLNLGYYKLNKL
jgi:hypothetical protein